MTFCVAAIFMTFYFSLTDFNMYSSPKFVGLKNYISVFKNDTFYAALVNTIKYVIVTVPAQVILSLSIAAFIAEKLRNKYGRFFAQCYFYSSDYFRNLQPLPYGKSFLNQTVY